MNYRATEPKEGSFHSTFSRLLLNSGDNNYTSSGTQYRKRQRMVEILAIS